MKPPKILVVDDSVAIHALLRVCLQDERVDLHSAYDGETGFQKAGILRPDLILLDVDMPGLDGFGVCRRLREDLLTMNTPIIFLTAASKTDHIVFGLELGACDYITKPFEGTELLARVRAALRVKSRMDLLSANRVDNFIGDAMRAYGKFAARA